MRHSRVRVRGSGNAILPLVVGAVWFSSGCWSDPIPLEGDEAQVRHTLAQVVPVGVTLDSAQRVLDRGSFACRLEDSVFVPGYPWTRRLYCQRIRGLEDWRLSVYLSEGDTVQDHHVIRGIIAP